MPIYTKTGDKGKTSLGSGKRIWKDDIRVEAYGTIDELNSIIGIVQATLPEKSPWSRDFSKILTIVQNDLFCIGSYLSNFDNTWLLEKLPDHTEKFEKQIDEMTEKMPPLANFILPGGSAVGAELHHARTVSRRAERKLVTLAKSENIENSVVKYVNRLSDLFFTMARFANFKQKKKEIIWNG